MLQLKRICISVFILIFTVFAPYRLDAELPRLVSPLFPLAKGNYWIYRGETRWTAPYQPGVQAQHMTWKMEVVELIERQKFRAAVIKGHPQDLIWYEPGRTRGDYLLICQDDDKLFLVGQDRFDQVLSRLRDEADALAGLLSDQELFLQRSGGIPRKDDQATEGPAARPSSWQVQKISAERSPSLPLDPYASRSGYRLLQKTLPDQVTMDVIPGLGITRYLYRHHGTVFETRMELVEFFVG